jgi:poly-gamma-glutamate capsule biosynthesis protein CapA/YwtB (metallophosphatase superfamily)
MRRVFLSLISVGALLGAAFVVSFVLKKPSTFATAQPSSRPPSAQPPMRITIAAVGDLMTHRTQIQAGLQADGSYNFTSFFAEVSPLLSSADLTLGNLETVTAGAKAKFTGYPAFNAPDEYVAACKNAGFDVLTTANNHSFDRAYQGIVRTLDVLDSLGIAHTGSTRSLEARSEPLVMDVKGIKLGIIAYTYALNQKHTPAKYATTVNLIDTAAIGADLDALQRLPATKRPDKIIAAMHWGSEYKLTPNTKQTAMATWCLQRGVDVILGAHPHVVQTVERRKVLRSGSRDSSDCVVVYSMGNFVSGQRPPPRETGVIVWLTLEKQAASSSTNTTVNVTKTAYTPTYIHRESARGEKIQGLQGKQFAFSVLPIPQTIAGLQARSPRLPTSVETRLQAALAEIQRQFTTPDSSFVLK